MEEMLTSVMLPHIPSPGQLTLHHLRPSTTQAASAQVFPYTSHLQLLHHLLSLYISPQTLMLLYPYVSPPQHLHLIQTTNINGPKLANII